MKDEIYNVFKQAVDDYKMLTTAWFYHDNCAFPKETYRLKIRKNFLINDIEEELLFAHDETYGDYEKGLVITNRNIYIFDDKFADERLVIPLNHFKKATYSDEMIHLYDKDDTLWLSIPIRYFTCKTFKRDRKHGDKMAAIISRIAEAAFNSNESQFNEFVDAINDTEDPEEQIRIVNHYLEVFPEGTIENPIIRYHLGDVYFNMDDYSNAAQIFFTTLSDENFSHNTPLYGELCTKFYISLEELGDITMARQFAFEAAIYADDKERLDTEYGPKTMNELASADFFRLNEMYTEQFLTLPYNKRKTLLIVDTIHDLKQDSFATLCIDSDLSKISFPIGHPKAGTLYVAHPKVESRYIPLDSYQQELVEDRVREFCELAQSLGASDIKISIDNSTTNTQEKSHGKTAGGGASVNGYGGGIHKGKAFGQRLIESISHHISLHQTFKPTKAPFIPKGLIWFDGEPSWQRMARQRTDGNMLLHEEHIETQRTQVVSDNELSQIRAEIHALYIQIGLDLSTFNEELFAAQEQAAISIKVKFASNDTLIEKSNPTKSNNKKTSINKQSNNKDKPIPSKRNANDSSLSTSETQYIDEVKNCMGNGEITAIGQRILKRLRLQLNISDERAAQLEEIVKKSTITEDEQEYIDAFREMKAGSDNESGRKMLKRLQQLLNISDERAKELESL